MVNDPVDAILQDVRAETEDDVCIYSDSSGFEGKIGGAAVLRRGGEKKKMLKFHLGPESLKQPNKPVYRALGNPTRGKVT